MLASLDIAELIEPVDNAPAGARGSVLERHSDDTVMVEVLQTGLDNAARIVLVPSTKLRAVEAGSRGR